MHHADPPSYSPPVLSNVKCVFFLEEENKKAAEALASLEWMQRPENNNARAFFLPDKHIHELEDKSREHLNTDDEASYFMGMQEKDFHSMVFLGHASRQEYGAYSAEAFAEKFAKHFNMTELKEDCVGELSLIGCELGLIARDGKSLGQKIVDLLKPTFPNVSIRAIASPTPLPKKAGMIIEITANAGTGVYVGKRNGYLSGYLLDSEDKKEFDAALDQNIGLNQAIDQIKQKNPVYFLHNANPAVELAKAENLFLAGETLEKRAERIAKDPDYQRRHELSEEKQVAQRLIIDRIAHIKNRMAAKRAHRDKILTGKKIRLLKKAVPKKIVEKIDDIVQKQPRRSRLVENLQLLVSTLEHTDPKQYKIKLAFNLPRFQSPIFREKHSHTYDMLEALEKGDLKKAHEKVSEKNQPSENEETMQASGSLPVQTIIIPNRIAQKLPKNDRKGKTKKLFESRSAASSWEPVKHKVVNRHSDNEVEITSTNRARTKQKHEKIRERWGLAGGDPKFVNAIAEIDDLIDRLDTEIETLSKKCFAFFNAYEIRTKQIKKWQLEDLKENAKSYEDLMRNAQRAINSPVDTRAFNARKENKNAKGEWVKNRTRALIIRIIKGDSFDYEPAVRKNHGRRN